MHEGDRQHDQEKDPQRRPRHRVSAYQALRRDPGRHEEDENEHERIARNHRGDIRKIGQRQVSRACVTGFGRLRSAFGPRSYYRMPAPRRARRSRRHDRRGAAGCAASLPPRPGRVSGARPRPPTRQPAPPRPWASCLRAAAAADLGAAGQRSRVRLSARTKRTSEENF